MPEQTTLTWAEAEKKDELDSRYLSVGSNTEVKLTFTDMPLDDKDAFDGKCVTGRLVKKLMPMWENGKKTDKTEEKVVLQMVVSSINGEACQKIWNIKSAKMRGLFRTYAENNLLTSKIFIVKVKGEIVKGDYTVVGLDKPKN